MNILIFTVVVWDNKNSVGNTISNWFCGKIWELENFFNFYAREGRPSNNAKVKYYKLSDFDVLHGIFSGRIVGKEFCSEDELKIDNNNQGREKKYIDVIHKRHLNFVYFAHEVLWMSNLWISNKLRDFIKCSCPKVLFAFAGGPESLYPIINYLQKNTKCKVVLFIADDVYGSYDNVAFYRRWYLKSWFRKCIMAADKLYGASEELCAAYSKMFGKEIIPLYKGCDLSLQPKGYLNDVLRIVYAGNLFYGRAETLGKLAEALEKINQDGLKATLEIYTGTTITEEFDRLLNRGESSRLMGSRQYDEIKKIMHGADMVLHVESFEQTQIDGVWGSFSTKIIDCLQSGSQVLAIGPEGIASIEYLRKVDGAVVIDDLSDIERSLYVLMGDREKMLQNIVATREYALLHHEISNVQKRLHEDLEKLIAE